MKLCTRLKKTPDELKRKAVEKKNEAMAADFARIPFSERMVFVPHCMRNVESCAAKEMGSYYVCLECGRCKIAPISKKCKELGYKAMFVLKGGRAVEKLMKEHRPKAIVGVACFYEGEQGMEQAEKGKAVVQFVPLTKDGCADTDVNLDNVFKVLEQKQQ